MCWQMYLYLWGRGLRGAVKWIDCMCPLNYICANTVFQLVDFEAMTTPSPDSFSKTAKSWMTLKRQGDKTCFFLPVIPPLYRPPHLRLPPSPQSTKLVPESSICSRDLPVQQNDDRGSQYRLVFTLPKEVLTRLLRGRDVCSIKS